MLDLSNYPLIEARQNTQFFTDLTGPDAIMPVNDGSMTRATWNIICSHRDLKMWTKWKMKPTASWRVTDCKRYFGLKGSGQKLLAQFEDLKAEHDRLIEDFKQIRAEQIRTQLISTLSSQQ